MKYAFFGLYVALCSLLALIFSSIISMILGLDLKIIFALDALFDNLFRAFTLYKNHRRTQNQCANF